jgi:hypothetical protein
LVDKKISQLANLTGASLADDDEFVFVDTSADETKAITWSELKEGLDTGTGFVRITGDTMTGDLTVPNVVVSGNVDGRDVSVDGTKLDGIEAGADVNTVDSVNTQTGSVVLDADDISDTTTTNKFTTAGDISKLSGIEAGATADQTKADIDALNVDADTLDGQHGSYYTGYTDTAVANLVDSAPATLDTLNELAAALGDDPNFATTIANSVATKLPKSGGAMTGAITTNSTFDGRSVATDGTKLDGIEAGADVTDTANVTASGALMDSEVTNLAQVKAFDSADYATAAQGTTADAALPKAGGAMTGAITTNSTFDGRDVATDGTKLDGIEASADVTDTTNVTAAGALMDSEVTNLAQVKAFDSADYATAAQGVLADGAVQPNDSPTFNAVIATSYAGDGSALTGLPAGYTNSDVDTHLNTSTAANGEVLSWTGTDYDWIAAAGGIAYTRHTANVTMAANEGVIADTSGGAFTVTLPASPATGDTVVITDGGDWATTNLTVGRNGSTIEGDAADMTMDIGGAAVQFTYDGTTWQTYAQIGAVAGLGTTRVNFVATAGQTDFSVTYSAGFIDVYLNGIKLINGSDFTATNGTTVVLTVGATVGDTVDTVAYSPFSVADTVPASAGGTFSGGINVTGNVGIGTTSPSEALTVIGSSVVGDSTTSYNQLTVNGGHVGDGDNDYGITIKAFEPAITLLDRSTGSGSGQMRVQSDGSFWFLRDSTNDGTIGHNSNTTDSVIAKLEADGTVRATAFAGDGSALTGIGSTTYDAVGTYIFGRRAGSTADQVQFVAGTTYAGSTLYPAGISSNSADTALRYNTSSGSLYSGEATSAAVSGTWRAMGTTRAGNTFRENPVTLFVRIS